MVHEPKPCAYCKELFLPRYKRSRAEFARMRFCKQSCAAKHNIGIANGGWNKTRHRMTRTATYRSWQAMKARCGNPKHQAYAYYGGKGIQVCRRWRESFDAFLADMGEVPHGLTLERIDNSKGYEPGNCRWATRLEQAANTRLVRKIAYQGRALSMAEWARQLGCSASVFRARISRLGEVAGLESFLATGAANSPGKPESSRGRK